MEVESLKNMTIVLATQASFVFYILTQHYSGAITCFAGFMWLLCRIKKTSTHSLTTRNRHQEPNLN